MHWYMGITATETVRLQWCPAMEPILLPRGEKAGMRGPRLTDGVWRLTRCPVEG